MKYRFSALVLLVLVACKKNNDTPEPTNTEHISSAQWQYEDGGVDSDKNGSIDINFSLGFVPACLLDNKVSFQANGTGVADESANVCPNASQTTNFNWSFSNNETKININGNGLFGAGGTFDVVTLNSTRLTLRKDTTLPNLPGSVWMTVHFKH